MKRWEARRYCAAIEALAKELGGLWKDDPPRFTEPDLCPDVAPDIDRALRVAHRSLVDLGFPDHPLKANDPTARAVREAQNAVDVDAGDAGDAGARPVTMPTPPRPRRRAP